MTPTQFDLATFALRRVCNHYGLSQEAIWSRSRIETLCEARFVWWKLCSDAGLSQTEIGALDGRTHSAVSHGLKTITDRLDTEPRLRKVVGKLAVAKAKGVRV